MRSRRPRLLPKLVIASMLVLMGVGALAAMFTVFGEGRLGGGAFIATGDGSQGLDDEPREQVLIAASSPAKTSIVEGVTSTTTDPGAAVETGETATSNPETTTTTIQEAGLHDLPPLETPDGYEILDQWIDGPSRVTIWSTGNTDADRSALEEFARSGTETWSVVETGDADGATWAKLEHVSHPWCLWIEVYDKGPERSDLEDQSGLTGPQFLVAETPFCAAGPGSFA